MTTTEFIRWGKQGLGRTVIKLRAEEDKSPFYSIVLDAVIDTGDLFGKSGVYLYNLIRCFDNECGLMSAAIEHASTYRRSENGEIQPSKILELLSLLCKYGNAAAGDKLEELYASLYAQICRRVLYPCDVEMAAYINTAIALADAKGEERMMRLLRDIGALFDRQELYSKMDFINLCNNFPGRGDGIFDRAMSAIRAENGGMFAFGDLYDYINNFYKTKFFKTGIQIDLNKRIEIDPDTKDGNNTVYEPIVYMPEEALSKTAQAIIVETNLWKKCELLMQFVSRNITWPLEPSVLIDIARENESFFNFSGRPFPPEKVLADNSVNLLAALHNNAVHNYAWELIERGHISQGVMLLVHNLHPDERDRFDILFKQLDLSNINDTVFAFYNACRLDTFDSPTIYCSTYTKIPIRTCGI
jgi:hypothetical protein